LNSELTDLSPEPVKEQEGPLRCGCCRKRIKRLGEAETLVLGPIVWQCECRDKDKCLYCGRCPEHHKCGQRFFKG